jgi:hypothetical protein
MSCLGKLRLAYFYNIADRQYFKWIVVVLGLIRLPTTVLLIFDGRMRFVAQNKITALVIMSLFLGLLLNERHLCLTILILKI